jgi:hypothetical protein
MRKIINKGQYNVYLYIKQENNIRFVIKLLKNGQINLRWCKASNESCAKDSYARQLIINALKINGCAKCGYNRCNSCLDFHHTNPEDRKYSIMKSNITKKDFIDELNKCILLCNRCHQEIERCPELWRKKNERK